MRSSSGTVTFFASRAFREIDLVSRLGTDRRRLILQPGEESPPLALEPTGR